MSRLARKKGSRSDPDKVLENFTTREELMNTEISIVIIIMIIIEVYARSGVTGYYSIKRLGALVRSWANLPNNN